MLTTVGSPWFAPGSASEKLRSQMTLDEKPGQMTQPDHKQLKDAADVENYFVGSLPSSRCALRRLPPHGQTPVCVAALHGGGFRTRLLSNMPRRGAARFRQVRKITLPEP
jgi:hypothetical protein